MNVSMHSNISPVLKAINDLFHQPSTTGFHRLNLVVWLLVVLSICLLFVALYIGESHPWIPTLDFIDGILLWIFGLEYLLRIASYHPPVLDVLTLSKIDRVRHNITERLLFAAKPLNLIDLLTVLGGTPALRALRIFRMLKLFRIMQTFDVLRYSNPFYGILDAYEKNQLLYAFGFFILLGSTTLGGISIYMAEHHINDGITSLPDGLWWAMVTLTTVGYGDISPLTGIGRIIGGTLMVVGMFTLALFAGIVSQTLLSSVLSLREEQFRMSSTMKHLVICGYSSSSRSLLNTIEEEFDFNTMKPIILAPFERPPNIPVDFEWIQGDPTKESELDKVRLVYAEACIIVADQHNNPQTADARTILTIFTLRSYLNKHPITKTRQKPITIAVEILEEENITHAQTAGADEIVSSTKLGYSMLSHAVNQRGSAKILDSLVSAKSQNLYVISDIENYPLNKTFSTVQQELRLCYGILVIGIRQNGIDQINPPDNTIVNPGDCIIYLSSDSIHKPYLPTSIEPTST